MSEGTQPAGRPHRNHGLFSDHYLDVTLPGRPEWKGLVEQARPVMEEVASLFDSFTPSANEAQTEEDLVRRVLRILGHDYEVQAPLVTPDGTKRPDYVFYEDEPALKENKDRTLDDAEYWDRPLDVSLKGKGDPFTNKKAREHKTPR